MKFLIIFSLTLSMNLPSKVNACDPNCDLVVAVIVGAPVALMSTIVFPLFGRRIYGEENSPYWKAVGYTFIASSTGVLIAFARYDGSAGSVAETDKVLNEFIGFPVVLGAFASYYTYYISDRRADKISGAVRQIIPYISVSPFDGNKFIKLNWSF